MDVERKEVDLSLAHRFLHPRNVVLVSCADKAGKANIITIAWSTPLSVDPPLVAVSIAPTRYSHRLIEETKEFAVNVPTMNIVRETLFCGRRTGRIHDKFKEAKLTPVPSKALRCPVIKECIAHLECKVHQQITAGDHTLFIGRVLAAYANEKIFDRRFDLQKTKLIFHCGEDDFVTLASDIVTPQL